MSRLTEFKLYWEEWGGYPDRDYPFGNPTLTWLIASKDAAARRRAWLSVGLLFWLACRCASAQGVGAQIIAALERYRIAVVQMDYDDEVAAFADDAELSQGSDPPLHGRAQIRAQIQSQAAFKVVAYELHVAITRVQGTIAIQNGLYSQRIISPQHESILSKGVFEVQWTRQSDGTWLINRLHTDPVDDGH